MRPNKERAKLAIIFIWISLAIDILSGFSSWLQLNLLRSYQDGFDVSEASFEANDVREGIIGLLLVVVLILTATFYIRWFRRAYFNLHTKATGLSLSEGWAAGGWFVPFLNLFYPYKIMKELYQRTDELLTKHMDEYRGGLSTVMVGVWWMFWIFEGIYSQIESRLIGMQSR